MKKSIVFHPFLFALHPVLFMYAHNIEQVTFPEVLSPLGIVLAVTLALFGLLRLIYRDIEKAGVILSFFLIIFFSYSRLYQAVCQLQAGGFIIGRNRYLLAVCLFAICSCAFWLLRTRRPMGNLTRILNAVSIVLIAMSVVNIGVFAFRTGDTRSYLKNVESQLSEVELTRPAAPPDIYYIIFDRYAAADTLEEVYGFDNSEFLDYLRGKGFYVADRSTANYIKTRLSLASSLNMEYLNYLSDEFGKDCLDLIPLAMMIWNNRVARSLQKLGYKYVHLGSTWEVTRDNKNADLNLNYTSIPEFSMLLFQTTMLYTCGIKFNWFDDRLHERYKSFLYKAEVIGELPELDGEAPLFVFSHFYVPHRPHVLNADCTYLERAQADKRGEREKYINQLICANQKTRLFIDEILSKSKRPVVIILQADEGPVPLRILNFDLNGRLHDVDWREASREEYREKFRILNAYYLPGVDERELYPSITPVNTFRLIFNLYFNAGLELLPDRNYGSGGIRMYDFFDLTEQVKYR